MTHHFMPFVRFGLATNIGQVETFNAAVRARVTVPVTLRVNDVTGRDISKALTIAGPADVIGIDPAEIVRTEPRHLTPDFPPNLFAAIEFDRPDFPWLFTPAAAQGEGLRPWVVLAVVRKSVATIRMTPGRPLPTLTCPASELPDLTESWLWAHATYVGELGTSALPDLMASRPDQTVSRLLCSRRLEPSLGGPDAGYYACVLPAFDVGRRAGLGDDLSEADLATLAPAWSSSGVVDVPVYYQWEFDTGPDGDFEEAVDRLQLRRDPIGTPIVMDARRPDPRLPDLGPLLVPVASALRTVEATEPPLPATLPALQARLKAVIESPGDGTTVPIYGRWQASGDGAYGPTPLAAGAAPRWLGELNLDPRYRVAAALGAQVVQQQQEQLVAAAWQQAGEVEAVNALLRQKQLAREVSQAIYEKRVAPLTPAAATQVTSAAITPPGTTGSAKPNPTTEALRKALTSPEFRRLARPLGPRIAVPPAPPMDLRIVEGAPTPPPSSGLAPPKAIGALLTKVMQGTTVVDAPSSVPTKTSTFGTSGKLMKVTTTGATTTPTLSPAVAMKPYDTFKADVQSQVVIPPDTEASRPDPLAPVMFTPSFDHPMYEPLVELSAQMLLPGLDQLPNNSVLLLKVNPAFVEAYMAGLNDEMSRELLWREFPTSLRGTYFRQFWDVRQQLPANATAAQRESLRDIPPISNWMKALGSNMPAARGTGLFLLLFKGDLLRRFPTALIYAARAKWPATPTTPDVPVVDRAVAFAFPLLRLTPVKGVTMLGFNLVGPGGQLVTPATVAGAPTRTGDPGWFFVIEEHPTEPRFGLDLSRGALTSWRELSWNDVATRPDGYIQVAQREPVLQAPPATATQPVRDRYSRELRDVAWNRGAADMAYITMQMPFRLEVHSSYWFRSEAQ